MTLHPVARVPAWIRGRSDAQLAGAAVVLGVLWLVSLLFVFGMPGPVRNAFTLLGSIVAPVLATVAGVRLAAPRLGLTARPRRALLVVLPLAFVALALTANSFSVGFADADDGRPLGALARVSWVFAVTGVAAFAAGASIVLAVVLRRRLSRRASVAIALTAGVVIGPALAVVFLTPASTVLLSAAVFVWAVVRGGGVVRGDALVRGGAVSRGDGFAVPQLSAPLAADVTRERAILSAGASLATTLVVWCSGIAASIAGTGTDMASIGLGVAAAAGQLAVIPLLWSVSLIVGFRLPRVAPAARLGCAIASVVVVLAVAAMVATLSTTGDAFVLLVGVLGAGVGSWAAVVVWPLAAAWPTLSRIALCAVAGIAATVAYAVLAGLNGGVTLALASGFLAFGGARVLLRPRRDAERPNPAVERPAI